MTSVCATPQSPSSLGRALLTLNVLVTGRLARYQKVEGSGGLTAKDEFKTKEVNGLFDLMHAIEGRFFNGDVTNPEPAKQLKTAAAEARGKGCGNTPMTAEEFFKKYA